MSALGGIYNFDGSPVDPAKLLLLANDLRARGPDSNTMFASGCVGMVYSAFHTNHSSRAEIQPLISRRGVMLVWDGRLDNRVDLIPNLRLNESASDVEIVMQAYLKWGLSCFEKIIGDFGLALWDPSTATLFLARDAIGPRTLYYHINGQSVMWATELLPILDLRGTPIRIDDEYIAGFLTRLPMPGLTPYRDFLSVPPAHVVAINKGEVHSMCYWKPELCNEIRYNRDSEYEECFRSLFRESVASRLRVSGTVCAELSGGMDSSPIVCMANRLINRGEVEATALQTVSRVYDEASRSDERKYIQLVEDKIGKTGIHFREDDYRILDSARDEYAPCIPSYVATFRAYYKALDETMKSQGSRVVLTGFGGDEVQLGDGEPFPELVELLFRGKLLSLHRRAREWSKSSEEPYWQFLRKKLMSPLLPQKLQRERNQTVTTLLKFYNPEFIKRMDLRGRLFDMRSSISILSTGSCYRMNQFLYSTRQLSGGFWRELCDIEFSYPFMDRLLVEFMLAIPAEQIARPGQSKSLCKRALRDLLPSELIDRKEKRITIWHAASLTAKREARRIAHLFAQADPLVYQYLDRNAVLSAFEPDGNPDVLLLSLVPFVEWLQSVKRRQGPELVQTRAA